MFASRDDAITVTVPRAKLRAIFIAGFWLDLVLVFVPAYRATVGGFLGIGGVERSFSQFELIRQSFANGREGLGLFNVACVCMALAFAVMGSRHPQRWVFLAGGCFASFMLAIAIFSGSPPPLRPYPIVRLLELAASAMEITGFWVLQTRSEIPIQPTQSYIANVTTPHPQPRYRVGRRFGWLLFGLWAVAAIVSYACVLYACAPHPPRKTATFEAVFPNETDTLQINIEQNSLVLTGYLEVARKQSGGGVNVKRIPITGDVSTSGVPASINVPSSVVGAPDLMFGCFFDKSLNLSLVGNNSVPFPRHMRRVK